jgi:DNA-binding NtrC family response regulator
MNNGEYPMTNILVIDDDERLHGGLMRGFRTTRPTWNVTFAVSGEQALAKFQRMNFDVLVTDMDMPGMDGATLLSNVAAKSPSTMRVAMSGRYDYLTTYSMTNCSPMYLAKPFQVPELAEMIESALVVHRFELRRANIWLDDVYKNEGSPDVAKLSSDVRRRVNRERLKRLGVHLAE